MSDFSEEWPFGPSYGVMASVTVEATQSFNIVDRKNAGAKKSILKAFSELFLVLDPEPPCIYVVEDIEVCNLELVGDEINRSYRAVIRIDANDTEADALLLWLEEQGYYDRDTHEVDWSGAVNFMIADTTSCPDWAEFVNEDVSLDVAESRHGKVPVPSKQD